MSMQKNRAKNYNCRLQTYIRVKNAQKIKQINIKILQSVMELFVKSMNANNVNTVILAKLLEAEWFYRL